MQIPPPRSGPVRARNYVRSLVLTHDLMRSSQVVYLASELPAFCITTVEIKATQLMNRKSREIKVY